MLYATWCGRHLAERAKNNGGEPSVRCPRDRGESVKGGPPPPFHKSTMTNRNSPPRAAGAQGSFDCRREAPGGPRTGPQLQAELRPKAIRDQGPVRGPLDPDCRPEVGVPLPARRRASWGYAETGAIPLFEVRLARRATARLCRPEVGVPLPARHRASWGYTEMGAIPLFEVRLARQRTCGGRCRPEGRRSRGAAPCGEWRWEFRSPAGSDAGLETGAPSPPSLIKSRVRLDGQWAGR